MSESEKNAVWQGTLSLMILRTLLTMNEQHGYGIAPPHRADEQGTAVDQLRDAVSRRC